MIKIVHESPKSIFEEVQKFTDYDYALVHLFEEDEEYLNQFKQASLKGREIILDNSIFELEEAFDADKFYKWVKILKPTWYIVPDALENAYKTIDQMEDWNNKGYGYDASGKIGVVQGQTYDEIVDCYNYMNKEADVDMIAISFDYSYYTESVPHPNKYVSWMLGRIKLLGDLVRDGISSNNFCLSLNNSPSELYLMPFIPCTRIYSLDTSNPVVHGIKGIKYNSDGLWSKERQKLFELINYEVKDTNLILGNIHKFRWLANGSREI